MVMSIRRPQPRRTRAHISLSALAVLAAAPFLFASCAAEPSRRGARPPADATPGVLAITATDFIDTDSNKFRDTSTVVLYIFPESAQYQLPMRAEGTFDFALESQGKPLARWTMDEDRSGAARRQLPPGPGYVFELSLLELGSDRVNAPDAELIATFLPLDGSRPLRARTQSPLLLGSVGRSGGVP
jgi:hypothetical protein